MTSTDRVSHRRRPAGVNISPAERIATGVLGGAAIAYGLDRRGPLGLALAAGGAVLAARAATGRCPIYRRFTAPSPVIDVSRSATLYSTRATVYRVFRQFDKLPTFLQHVAEVEVTGPTTSRWTIREGRWTLTWDARITEEIEGRRLAWESLPGGDLEAEGAIELREAPADRGTEMTIRLRYRPPGAVAARPFRRLLEVITNHQLARELTRFRQLIETGSIATGARRLDQIEEREAATDAALGMAVPRVRRMRADNRTELAPEGR